MSHTCPHCKDTGSLSGLIEGMLDCARCPVAEIRFDLEKWAIENRVSVNHNDLWLIRQHVLEQERGTAHAG